MNTLMHRGAEEIGGNCIELESQGKTLLFDLGAPLSGDVSGRDALPPVKGLTDGSNPDLLGIVISHPHADHYGLAGFAHPSIPVYIGEEAGRMLQAAMHFGPFGADFAIARHYTHQKPFEVGPFRITPYLVDHSAFDSYSFLIEADGTRLFYSGDLRGHGWKAGLFDRLVASPPENVDAMLLEGTTLGREDEPMQSEADLVPRIAESMAGTKGMVLAGFSGQNIDRLVTFFKAARKTGREFVVDLYIAHLLKAIGRQSLPSPETHGLRVFLPQRMKSKIIRDKAFDLVAPYYEHRIYPDELVRRSHEILMTFRASMIGDLEKADCLQDSRLIYSMWPGYIDQQTPNLHDWCASHRMELEIIHTSGHASKGDLKRLVAALKPKTLIPIHTFAHEAYEDFGCPLRVIANGERFQLGN